MLHVGGQMQQLLGVEVVGMDGLNGKLAPRERACLVEHHGIYVGQSVHIGTALDEYSLAGSTAETGKKGERHADNQCAGTRNDKEYKCAVEPYGERNGKSGGGKQRRHKSQKHCGNDHNGGICASKPCYERLTARLHAVSPLDELYYLGHRALAKRLGGAHAEHSAEVYTARYHCVTRRHVARNALARERYGVE